MAVKQDAMIKYLGGIFQTQDANEIQKILTDMGDQAGPFLQEVEKAILENKPVEVFIKEFKEKSVQTAKQGAKLNYLKQLKGECPDGFNSVKLAKGGSICIKCGGKAKTKAKPKKIVKATGGLLEKLRNIKK